jgi:ADP-heptose:LPS heptosyltransferase
LKSCFISRLGGVGDVLHASHLPRIIKQYYGVEDITFETNYHGMHILTGNPYIDNLQFIDVNKMTYNRMSKNLEWARYNYDMVFNFANTIEKEYCCNENDWRYYTPSKWRREELGTMSYYDVMTDAAGIPDTFYGNRGILYYDQQNHDEAKRWVEITKNNFESDRVVLVNLSGSTPHKKFVQAESVCRKILDIYPKTVVVITGDQFCESQVFEHDQVINWVNKKNMRTVCLMCKYVDLTISLESGLPLVANSWDAPCLHLLTAASPDNHCKYAKNAHWIQSPITCSPCHKNPREYFGCPIKEGLPQCVYFDEEKIVEKVQEIFECY